MSAPPNPVIKGSADAAGQPSCLASAGDMSPSTAIVLGGMASPHPPDQPSFAQATSTEGRLNTETLVQIIAAVKSNRANEINQLILSVLKQNRVQQRQEQQQQEVEQLEQNISNGAPLETQTLAQIVDIIKNNPTNESNHLIASILKQNPWLMVAIIRQREEREMNPVGKSIQSGNGP